ncbi:hypothetical protein GF342_00555 [Candidatus Woesearchaeota archaeon]|nr:hypothetical protein [Candidatus Woesearchaeota archaeon]
MPKRAADVEIEEDVRFDDEPEDDEEYGVADLTIKDEDEDYDEVKENNDEDFWDDY